MAGSSVDDREFEFSGGRVGCLLIHGFTGSPYEMRYLGEHLHGQGFSVRGVRLAGHATSDEELITSGWREWYASAAAGLEALRASTDQVVLMGLSMGALLALQLAHDRPESVAGLVLMAPALVLPDQRIQLYARVLRLALPVLPRSWQTRTKPGSDILDEGARAIHPLYPIPMRGVVALATLQRLVRPLLPRITQPVLVMHGRRDRTCPLENVEIVRREIGSRSVRCHLLDRSGHVLTVDAEKHLVAMTAAEFAAEVARSSASDE